LLALGVTLGPEHDPRRRQHIANLAGRLGYRDVWLPVPPDADRPTAGGLALLAAAAAPARLGVVLTGPVGGYLPWVRATLAGADGVLLGAEVGPPERDAAVEALGGPAAWRSRAHVRPFDGAAAGCVLAARNRTELLDGVRAAAGARGRAGRTAADLPVTAELTVSIGRTMNEAVARALRDPAFAGDRHPRAGGLFGTLDEAQAQALELARAGADALRATLADEEDVADLLAQLRAVAVGPTAVLHARGH
jgi:hypothetical protein